MGSNGSLWTIPVASLVIIVLAVLVLLSADTYREEDAHTHRRGLHACIYLLTNSTVKRLKNTSERAARQQGTENRL